VKVIVTGGAGFIGTATAKELARRGHDVVAVGRTMPTTHAAANPHLPFVAADLADADLVNRLLGELEPEAIVHLAWYTDPRSYLTNRRENVASLGASVQLLAAAERVGCRRFVVGGTCLENAVVEVDTVYAQTKRSMHKVASEYFEAHRPRVACAHIFSAYGPGEHSDRVIPSIIRALSAGDEFLVNDGRPRRDYLHVDDIASALATITESSSGGQIDICSGVSLPLREVFSLLARLLDREALLRFGSEPASNMTSFDVQGDPARLRDLGWSPSFTINAGLRATVGAWIGSTNSELAQEHSTR